MLLLVPLLLVLLVLQVLLALVLLMLLLLLVVVLLLLVVVVLLLLRMVSIALHLLSQLCTSAQTRLKQASKPQLGHRARTLRPPRTASFEQTPHRRPPPPPPTPHPNPAARPVPVPASQVLRFIYHSGTRAGSLLSKTQTAIRHWTCQNKSYSQEGSKKAAHTRGRVAKAELSRRVPPELNPTAHSMQHAALQLQQTPGAGEPVDITHQQLPGARCQCQAPHS
jgi:hypothetical protein